VKKVRLNNFKVGGYKVFGDVVELDMVPGVKNFKHLSENVIEKREVNRINKNLKSSIIYGGNNSGKSSLLDGIMMMKKIFKRGNVENFPFDIFKNFCYKYDDLIRFEISILDNSINYTYGFEFKEEKAMGEYLIEENNLLFSRDIKGNIEGTFVDDDDFYKRLSDLPMDKLIIPYFLEYTKIVDDYEVFLIFENFFNKIEYIDNGENEVNMALYAEFIDDPAKTKLLNKVISSTELYLKRRDILSEEELYESKEFKELIKLDKTEEFKNMTDKDKSFKSLIELLRIVSVYKGRDDREVFKPSLLFDSVGTNKFVRLAMYIISTILKGNILLVDELDSSLHHKLTRALVILMNSEINTNAQFILTTHDVKLLSPKLFRKDQINFIVRDEQGVEVVPLEDFKANSDRDIRSDSNFEKMYVEEKIVPLPDTDIYQVIKEFKKHEKKTTTTN